MKPLPPNWKARSKSSMGRGVPATAVGDGTTSVAGGFWVTVGVSVGGGAVAVGLSVAVGVGVGLIEVTVARPVGVGKLEVGVGLAVDADVGGEVGVAEGMVPEAFAVGGGVAWALGTGPERVSTTATARIKRAIAVRPAIRHFIMILMRP